MKHAWLLLAAAAADITAGGALIAVTWGLPYWHALYCAIGTASTVGCDVTPRDAPGWASAVAVELTAIPLLAACFGVATSAHIGERLRRHHDTITRRLDEIQQTHPPAQRKRDTTP